MLALDSPDVLAPTRGLPREQLREALAELQTMRAVIDEQIDALRRLLEPVAFTGKTTYPRKRDAVLGLLRERAGSEMPLAQIRAHLVTRGEIPNTRKAAHALQMMLSTLAREGEVERVKQGVYRIKSYSGPGLFTELADPAPGTIGEVKRGEAGTP